MPPDLQSLLGSCLLLRFAWALSENRRTILARTIAACLTDAKFGALI